MVLVRPRASLDLLATFGVRDSFRGLRRALPRFYAACHLAELLIGMTREGESQPELFDGFREALSVFAGAPGDRLPPAIVAAELAALRRLGFAPSLTACASCASEVALQKPAVSVRLGGVLCGTCREADPSSRPFGAGALQALRHLEGTDSAAALRVRLPAIDARAIRDFLDAFEEWRLERPLRTSPFLR